MQNNTDKNKIIPIFYACDDAFVKYTIVSIKSLIENASKDRFYKIYILNTGVSENMKEEAEELNTDNAEIIFVDIRGKVEKTSDNLPLRDYYSKTTYFRFYISELYPEYDKAIYIDSDTVVLGDISELYDTEISDSYVGACNEQAMVQTDVYGTYVEQVLGINRNEYFNAGILLINCKAFRENKVLSEFLRLLGVYPFVVTQDQDYLNVICKGKVFWLDQAWNVEVYGELPVREEEIKIVHYIMVSKPWHFHDCRLKELFWNYAEKTSVYNEILGVLNEYTDAQRQKDMESCERLSQTAKYESERIDRYINLINSPCPDRLKVLEKIRLYEMEEKFDVDVEDDPETIVLKPDKVDYLAEKFSTRLSTKIA
ncbi:MAG: glycosyltransferase family 8 protein, partial [Clostridia bacterium]|nr:glycosyltransferase family 8 protein [Clostridia bacterium]